MKVIGVIVPTVDNSFFSLLAHSIEKCLGASGYKAVICDSDNNAEKEKEYLRLLSDSHAAGIIDVSGLNELSEGLVAEDMPLVFVDRKPTSHQKSVWVSNDDEAAMKEATEYLIGKGCDTILLLPGYVAEHTESPRVQGYKAALEENGLAYDPSLVLNREGKKSSEEETEDLVIRSITSGRKIKGIITSSDRAAFGAMRAMSKVGKYAPEDIKLISFDNSPYSTMASPSITAIDRNPLILAEKACEALIKLINKMPVEENLTIPVSLVKRDSTR